LVLASKPAILRRMTYHPITAIVPPVFAASPTLTKWWLDRRFAALVAVLDAPPYRCDSHDMARTILHTRSAGWIAGFLGECERCTNCGEPATRNGRCHACRTLPSDFD